MLAPTTAQGDILGALATGDNPCWTYKSSEKGFARKINAARGNAGALKLKLDPELSKAARKHTSEMWRADKLHHTPSGKLRHRVTNWTMLGENVGVGGTVRSLHAAFMASQGHKDNILYPTYRHVGIGVAKRNGRMWVTVIFEAVVNPGTTLPMPSC
jgi:uncharacterized protein YkwD